MTAPATPARRHGGLWPRSLLGRNLLLMAVLIVLGQLVAAVLVRQMIFQPRVAQVADGVARNVAALRAGLQALPPAQRVAFVEAFNRQAALATPPVAPESAARRALLSPLERQFVQAVARRLGVGDAPAQSPQPLWRRDSTGVLALRMVHEGADYWLNLPSVFPTREFTGAWLVATLASMLLALLGAWWLQRHIHQPLAQVVAAARQLARGQTPAVLPEAGPEEIATVGRSFNQMAQSLAAADHERALMLAGVSHDLRTPLTKLRLGVEIAGAQVDAPLAASMARSIDEMDAIVGQFLDFARVGADAGEAEAPATASLNDLAQAVAEAQADHGRVLALELGGLPNLPVRPQALRRALDNLVENAWRHGAAPVVLRTGGSAQQAWIEVADHGTGMDAKELDHMRQPFARGGGAARAGVPGAGLGLAIAERVARAHGGALELHSAPGQGLRARLVLPLAGPAAAAQPPGE
ncbi:HAMP domain-containing protein [Acidovorax sp. sif1233]|uniref:ATP-binding protein n=1 Tax=unclassified Acidovorax TaxID=2684926 RepID=UPI001C496CFA|nr:MULTISPECIES: ATP-binding protein [unclassified Acidovorax]MBV7430606.1 HAMP domain-containing protein [Acidovorax sp. sif0732]MBV7449030.1 HAMP domain-containing protein [Acidovorax sp. sif0715]MBV7456986.1 HAMP domain-containing protein [Acidovorax sp. sif1233]